MSDRGKTFWEDHVIPDSPLGCAFEFRRNVPCLLDIASNDINQFLKIIFVIVSHAPWQ